MIDDVVADVVKLFRWTAGHCKLQMINFGGVPAFSLLPGFKQITNTSHRAPSWPCDKILVLNPGKVTAGVTMHLPRRLYRDPLTTAASMTELLGGGCVTTSPASTDVMLSLASMHIQMPGVTLLDNNRLATSGFFHASRRWMLS